MKNTSIPRTTTRKPMPPYSSPIYALPPPLRTHLLQKDPGQCPNSHNARANAPIFHAALRLSCLPQGLTQKRVASDHDGQGGVWKTFFRAEWQSPTNTPRDRKTLAPTMSDKHNPPVYDLGKGQPPRPSRVTSVTRVLALTPTISLGTTTTQIPVFCSPLPSLP